MLRRGHDAVHVPAVYGSLLYGSRADGPFVFCVGIDSTTDTKQVSASRGLGNSRTLDRLLSTRPFAASRCFCGPSLPRVMSNILKIENCNVFRQRRPTVSDR